MTHPVFMSSEHVSIMNALLDASAETRAACAAMSRDATLAFRLFEEQTATTIWWQIRFSRDAGVRFFLHEPKPAADLTLTGDYWKMIDASRQSREMRPGESPPEPELTAIGAAETMTLIEQAFAAARRAATIDVTFPALADGPPR